MDSAFGMATKTLLLLLFLQVNFQFVPRLQKDSLKFGYVILDHNIAVTCLEIFYIFRCLFENYLCKIFNIILKLYNKTNIEIGTSTSLIQ